MVINPVRAEKTNSWNVDDGYFGDAANWSPTAILDLDERARLEISNGGTARISAGQSCSAGRDLLIAAAANSGTLLIEGDGSLRLKRNLTVGHSANGQGTVTLHDKASLSIVNGRILIGYGGDGVLSVAKGATVTVEQGHVTVSELQSGVLNLAGTLTTPNLRFGSESFEHNGKLNVESGATLKVTEELGFIGGGELSLRLVGSGSDISVGSLKASSSAIFQFVADEKGVSTIKGDSTMDVSEAKLEVDIDKFRFPNPSSKLVLVKGHSIVGKFATITWLGKNKANVQYDEPTGEIFITSEIGR
jgi:T5SS/PEP-CTERM-associated repeat protein